MAKEQIIFVAAVMIAVVGCNAIAGIEEPIAADVTPFIGTWVSEFPAMTDELTGCPGATFYKPDKAYKFVVTDEGAGSVTGTNQQDGSRCRIRFRVRDKTATMIDFDSCTFPFGETFLDVDYSTATFTLTGTDTGQFQLSGTASLRSDRNNQCLYRGDLMLRRQP